jgi:hypothetical protein
VFFQPAEPFVVEVIRQPEPARDISFDVVLGMFEMAGVLLAAAAVGSLLVGGVLVLITRLRRHGPPDPERSPRRLRI